MADSTKTPQIFFHVGLPKTASTFLQRKVFPCFQGIRFVKKHDFKYRDRIISRSDADYVLLSIEMDICNENDYKTLVSVADKYPNTKPIIVFRKHASWVGSKYKYYLRKHGTLSFEDYFDMDGENGILVQKNLRFFDRIEILEKYFKTRPLVMFQEEFQRHPMKAIDVLANFTHATYNENDIKISTVKKAYSEHALYYVRRLNRWYKYDHSNIKNRIWKFIYQKFGGGVLHLTAYVAGLMEPPKDKAKKVLPKEIVDSVNEVFADDWNKCVAYAKEDREVYL